MIYFYGQSLIKINFGIFIYLFIFCNCIKLMYWLSRVLSQGAHILVFPEDGLQGFNYTRSSISGYLETIPDPQQEHWNPCTEPQKHNGTEVDAPPEIK